MTRGDGEGAGGLARQWLPSRPHQAGPTPPLHLHPDAREGEWGGGDGATAVRTEREIGR